MDPSAVAVVSPKRREACTCGAMAQSLPLSKGSKAKIRNIMSAPYSHGLRWEWVTTNPIRHVRQSAKRGRVPTILSPQQIKELLDRLVDLPKTAVLLGASTGFRVGEILGLKWGRCRFPDSGTSSGPRCGQAANRTVQDGGFAEAGSNRCGGCGDPVGVAHALCLQPSRGLGIRQSREGRQTALLAELDLPCVPQAGP